MRVEDVRKGIVDRLRARNQEIEHAILTRVHGLAEPTEVADPEYVEGLRAAVVAAIDFWISGLEPNRIRPAPVPTSLLSQARLAARNSVSVDTVLRRLVAGHTVLADYLIQEADQVGPIPGAALKPLLRGQAVLLDRMLSAVSVEYSRERKESKSTEAEARTDRVRGLLAGEMLDHSELAYDFVGFHLGIVVSGDSAVEFAGRLATSYDCRTLTVCPRPKVVWTWLGSRSKPDYEAVAALVKSHPPTGVSVAIGEPGEGLSGWRLTHRQAQAALSVARRLDTKICRYARVALLASTYTDDLLTTSLQELYLAPLRSGRGGDSLLETLRAYFAAERNETAAAAALGVARQTVKNRLRTIEERLGPDLLGTGLEMEVALLLSEFNGTVPC